MPSCIESLEGRTLFSAASLSVDEATLTAAITSLPSLASTNVSTVEGDVAGQSLTKADKALGVKWEKGLDAKYKVLLKANTAGQKAVNKDVAKLDAATGAKATAAATKLSKDAAKALAAITKDTTAVHTADTAGLTAIGNALPNDTQLQSGIVTIESNDGAAFSSIQTDAGTVFTTDVGDIVTAG
ncbi:MAG TPA: hypothetical protein VHY37_03210 [Tepidisphaeraceae bacterium]|jgi:hypothetical protein|nr:hypothetical protein [Tepidisphaeraceae bacterium]